MAGGPRLYGLQIACLSAGLLVLGWSDAATPSEAGSAGNLPQFAWTTNVQPNQWADETQNRAPTQPERLAPRSAASTPSASARAVSADVRLAGQQTIFELKLSRGVPAEVYSLANPFRVVIDLPDVIFELPDDAGRSATGLASAFRFGQFDEGKARIVIDTTGPVRISEAVMAHASDGPGIVLRVVLEASDTASFGGGTGAARGTQSANGAASPTLDERSPDEPVRTPARRAKPVVVIDPGHGGIDPGAIGPDNMLEKNLVLAVARRVRAKLGASGRYQVVMTREKDIFVSLDRRVEVSRANAADLFISLHADSIDQPAFAQAVKGATIYTLSEQASDAQARAMAEKENASDLLAGLEVTEGPASSDVRDILIDLMKRETANFSNEFSRTLIHAMRSRISLARDPRRSAAFKVLKQPHAPSVLIELGYISHVEEARQMSSAEWQDNVASAITSAVETYFSSRVRAN